MSIQQNFNRFAHSYNAHAIVQTEVAKRMIERLELIPLDKVNILELGAGTGIFTQKLIKKFGTQGLLATDFARAPLALNPALHTALQDAHHLTLDEKYNAIVSNLMMQWCNADIVCQQVRRVATPNALFLFSSFGPLTLSELRKSWHAVDSDTHVREFQDMHNIADMMSAHGFTGIVAESEYITLTYERISDILKDIKYIGAQNPQPKPTTKSKLARMYDAYEQFRIKDKLPVTYEVLYIHGWHIGSKAYTDINIEHI